MRRSVLSCFLIMMSLVHSSLTQVRIREKIQIQPTPRLTTTTTSSSASYLSPPTFLTPTVGLPRVALPSNVSVSGTINFTPGQLELGQSVLLRLTGVGPTAFELHFIQKTGSGQLIERKNTFSGPVGVCGGGAPQMQTFDGSIGSASVVFSNSGSQVTYTLTGGVRQGRNRITVPVTATVTSSGDAQPGYSLAQWNIGSSQDSLIGSGTETMTITAINASGDQYFVCNTPNVDANVTVSLQAQGAYAYLVGSDGQQGSTITIPFLSGTGFSAVKTFSVVLDESRGSVPNGRDVATISVSGGSATNTKQIVLKSAFDHFEITLEKDEIAFTETSKIFVQAKDPNNNDLEINGDTELLFSLGGESAYGTFIKPNGDTVKTADPEVDRVKYSEAKDGKVIFAAVAANPETSGKPRIVVALQSDASKKGEKEISVLEQHLKIVMIGPKEVFPIVPPYTPQKPHAENTTAFEVQLTRGGQPIANHSFSLFSNYIDGSGGHDHSSYAGYVPERRSKGTDVMFQNYGHFVSKQDNERSNPVEENTLSNGIAMFEYVSSRFGDVMKLRVESIQFPELLWDTTSIIERVPHLELLPSSPSYIKIGGMPHHHGPSYKQESEMPSTFRTPDNNHWGTRFALVAIDSIASNYRQLFPDDLLLQVNDISVPLGGKFDISGEWIGDLQHKYHRIGLDVDVRSTTIPEGDEFSEEDDSNGNGRLDVGERFRDVNGNGNFERNREAFQLLCTVVGKAYRVKLESNFEHYHIYFWIPAY